MTSVKKVEIPEIEAFKLFTRDDEGQLRSAFSRSYNGKLHYEPNKRTRVNEDDKTFFAFGEKKQAMGFASRAHQGWYGDAGNRGRWSWDIVRGLVIVLPVTLYDVVQQGEFHVPSGDIQTMDGYYLAYEAKEIVVHDTEDTRNDFLDEILARFFKKNKYSLSAIEREAIKNRLPNMAEHIL